MPQLLFKPSATKIGDDDWLVVPENDTDSIDVSEVVVEEGEEPVTDIRTGSYKFVARCNTITKDIILAFWGTPTGSNGVYAGHTHTADIIETICNQYENIWLPDETTGKYIIEGGDGEEDKEYDTLEEAVTVLVQYIKIRLRHPNQSQVEEESEE